MPTQDINQPTGGGNIGHGEFSGVRYRGQGFIPSADGNLYSLGWQMNDLGSKGMKVYIDTADANSLPNNGIGGELYSWEIVNADLSSSFKEYVLPVPLALTGGVRYIFYLAPWDTSSHAYSDDYRNMDWATSNPYADGRGTKLESGVWQTDGGLDLHFDTFMNFGGGSAIKKVMGIAQASVKKVSSVAIASVKKLAGIANS